MHVPRYNDLAPTMKKHGVDEVCCISVNDGFVMDSWAAAQDAKNVIYLPDRNGDFTKSMNILVDNSDIIFVQRFWQYSMLMKDGYNCVVIVHTSQIGFTTSQSMCACVCACVRARVCESGFTSTPM